MPSYLHPGVYVEERSSGVKPISGVGTSTALFAGFTTKGSVGKAQLISGPDQFSTGFGDIMPTGQSAHNEMAYAIKAFFANGGGKAYVVRLADGTESATITGLAGFTFTATSPGVWANQVVIRLTPDAAEGDTLTVANTLFNLEIGIGDTSTIKVQESFPGVSLDAANANYINTIVNQTSEQLSMVANETAIEDSDLADFMDGGVPQAQSYVVTTQGLDGTVSSSTAYEEIFPEMEKYTDINIICLPGKYWADNQGKTEIQAALSHCAKMQNCMVILDLPKNTTLSSSADIVACNLPNSTYACLYYPWLNITNPHAGPKNPAQPPSLQVAPSAYAAGIWAKIDNKRGVWKAPAGLDTGLLGFNNLTEHIDNTAQDSLNPKGVNALRNLPQGTVVWGARTLATEADPEWRYISVRRTAIYIEQSLYNGIQWAVFEPNNDNLWGSLRLNVSSFLDGLFRSGAFQGSKASDAYFVRCGLGSTMTQGDIDRGQVIIEVGFAPLKPAEFVIVRLQQMAGEQ